MERQWLFEQRPGRGASASLHPTALGYGEASATGLSTFDGVTTDADMVLVRYTYSGDANLDGKVNALDFNAIATNFGVSGANLWTQGDFNFSGNVDTSDFMLLGQNFGQVLAAPALSGTPAPVLGSLVPEPGSLMLLALGAGMLMPRRRRS